MAVKTVKVQIDGRDYDLSYNATTKKWVGTIVAPATTSYNQPNHKYGIKVIASDMANNEAFIDRDNPDLGSKLQLRVREKQKPIVDIISPATGAMLTESDVTINFGLWNVGGSGIDINTLELKIDNTTQDKAKITIEQKDNKYICSYKTKLDDGKHNLEINIQDNDGNLNEKMVNTFEVDTIPPALNVSEPLNNSYTNKFDISVKGTTTDNTMPIAVTIKVNGVDQGKIELVDGKFTKAIKGVEGKNTIVIRSTDGAGKFSEVTRIVTVDTIMPIITNIELPDDDVDVSGTVTISVTVEDA